MNSDDRARFDALFEQVLAELPHSIRERFERTPVIIEDEPSFQQREELGLVDGDDLCGLHSGVPLTERSIEHPDDEFETIQIFRRGIITAAGGWIAGERAVQREIRITLLHEIGHHFGLDEDDLEALGYG